MSQRRLIALGTASQVPTRHRNHNGYFLQWDGEGLLFDPGEGTQRQMLLAGVSVSSITKILITHFHGDHCLGLAGIIQRLSLDRVGHAVQVFFPASGITYFENLRAASIFHETATLDVLPIQEEGVFSQNKNMSIEALALDHRVDTLGYRVCEPDRRRMLPDKLEALGIRGPAVGQLVRDGFLLIDDRRVVLEQVSVPCRGQSMAFVMDTRLCDNAYALAKDVDLLVCESTYLTSEAQDAETNGHLTAAQAATIAKQSQARRLVLTHFSQRYPDNASFLEEACPIFPSTVAAADGDVINVPPRR